MDRPLKNREALQTLVCYERETGLFRWLISRGGLHPGDIAGGTDTHGYKQIKIDGHMYLAHRLAWLFVYGQWPTGALDHIDGDRRNNRIDNLRLATLSDNAHNRKLNSNSSTGRKGVAWFKANKKYMAHIRVNGKRIHLGYFVDIEDASRAYAEAATKHFGEFARLQ